MYNGIHFHIVGNALKLFHGKQEHVAAVDMLGIGKLRITLHGFQTCTLNANSRYEIPHSFWILLQHISYATCI